MILVDTSVWIDHFRHTENGLVRLLNFASVLTHPFVIGELALGHLKNRGEKSDALRNLPQAIIATDGEVMHLIDSNSLHGKGIGYIDAHLLAAAKLSKATIWTRDKALLKISKSLHLATSLPH